MGLKWKKGDDGGGEKGEEMIMDLRFFKVYIDFRFCRFFRCEFKVIIDFCFKGVFIDKVFVLVDKCGKWRRWGSVKDFFKEYYCIEEDDKKKKK